jgi:hypothetical protein
MSRHAWMINDLSRKTEVIVETLQAVGMKRCWDLPGDISTLSRMQSAAAT